MWVRHYGGYMLTEIIVLQAVLIALNAFFASAESAVITAKDARLTKLAADGDRRAERLVRLTSKPNRFLDMIQAALTLTGFICSAFAALGFSGYVTEFLVGLGIPESNEGLLTSISAIIITFVLSFITLILGEIVPRRAAAQNAEKTALALSAPICFAAAILSPFCGAVTAVSNAVLRIFGIDPDNVGAEVTEEGIRMMVDAGSEKGAIDEDEKELIQNVFEFDDLPIEELCTHRTNLTLLWTEDSPEKWDEIIHDSDHGMYPVCDENIDDVIGVLNARKYFRLKDKSRENVMKEAVAPAYFIPGSVKADVLFKNMKSSGNSFAVVVDEYGGMSGVITMYDLIQAIVGDLDDAEDGKSGGDIVKVDGEENTWLICGTADIEEVEETLGVEFPEDEDYETFGGFVFATYGSIPDDGTTFELDAFGLHVNVLEIKDHRLISARVVVSTHNDGDEDVLS